MDLLFAFIANYADHNSHGLLSAAGIFDGVNAVGIDGPIPFPRCFLVVKVQAPLTGGTQQSIELACTDGDGRDVFPPTTIPLKFASRGPGYRLQAQAVMELSGLAVPGPGDYVFRLRAGGRQIGEVPVVVARVEQPAPE
jgi:hypothetical protein